MSVKRQATVREGLQCQAYADLEALCADPQVDVVYRCHPQPVACATRHHGRTKWEARDRREAAGADIEDCLAIVSEVDKREQARCWSRP